MPPPVPHRHSAERWIIVAILVVAAAFRIAALDIKPVHFDEAVNGSFVDRITRFGYYHYEPSNFHGPLHFYLLFVFQTLLGRNLWALRLPTMLASVGCVALMLAFRPYWPRRACLLAAAAMATSPAMVFYGRDAIHETWLVFFLMLAAWGIVGLWSEGRRTHLWAAGLGVSGMILTKETYVLHLAAMSGAALLVVWTRRATPERAALFHPQRQEWARRDALRVAAVCIGLILFFYSGGLLDWPARVPADDEPRGSVAGLYETFAFWGRTGLAEESGHEKPWSYWLELVARYEWPALIGFAGMCIGAASSRRDPRTQWFALHGVAAIAAYTFIPYKTPWCLISILWPCHFFFGIAIDRALITLDRWMVALTALGAGLFSCAVCWQLNFRDFTNEDEPYVYVQTLPEIHKLLDPLTMLVRVDPIYFHIPGYIMTTDHHPFPWLLGDFTQARMLDPDDEPDPPDADFLLIDEARVEEVEARLTQNYFKEILRVRGNAEDASVLYLDASRFRVCFPGRAPEFVR
ncbi:MAG TPA: flippase activity-associated protein Agl23 [Chthoniobacteraceae bacterium]|nr:flippase activity-associated protein Agl23 [Chthoniobacteraceae bacterium]